MKLKDEEVSDRAAKNFLLQKIFMVKAFNEKIVRDEDCEVKKDITVYGHRKSTFKL